MNRVVKKIKKYFSILWVSIINMFVYPLELVYANIFILLVVFVMSQVWQVVFVQNAGQLIDGFSLIDMVWYVFITELIVTSQPRIIMLLGEEIKSGSISYILNKPYSFLAYHLFSSLGGTLVRIFFKIFFGCLVIGFAFAWPGVSILVVLLTLLNIIGALVLGYFLAATFALAAFWLEDTYSIRFIYQKILFIFGGLLFPIDIYPIWLQKIAHFLPFEDILYGPARLFVKFDLIYWQNLMFSQLVWIIVFILLSKFIYVQGIKKVNINGG